MPNYSLGKIYKIVNSENSKVYIGSTAKRLLCHRMGGHRTDARVGTSILYKAMRKIGIDKFKIELIKEYPCDSKAELEKEEFRIIQKLVKKGVSLYNTVTEQKGCVSFEGKSTSGNWRFYWYPVPGKKKNKSFSVNKYGDAGAKAMAIAYQDKIYPKI